MRNFPAYCLLPTAYCLLPTAYSLATRYSLLATRMLRTERIVTVLTLLLVGLGLVVAIDQGMVGLPTGEGDTGDPQALAIMAALTLGLVGLAAFGAEWVVRAHPI